MKRVDNLILGGGMTYTFKAAQGGKVGTSICEPDQFRTALDILKKAEELNVKIYLAEDAVCGKEFKNDTETKICPSNDIPDGWEGLDIGPKATEAFTKVIAESKTILWNGPVGVFEMDNFAKGSRALAEAIVEATKKGAFSLIGGGDSVAAINKFGLAGDVSYVSTGGGARSSTWKASSSGRGGYPQVAPVPVSLSAAVLDQEPPLFRTLRPSRRKPGTEERSGRKISSGSVVRNNATTHKSISGLLGSVRTGNRTQKDNPTDRILFSRQSRIDAAVGRNEPAATNNRRRRSTHAPPGIRHGPLHPVPDGENGFGPAGSRKRFFTGNDRRQKIGPQGASLRPDQTLHRRNRPYLLRLMIEATMAASEAVEDIMPIAFASPLPLGSCFIGTTIWHPGSTAGYRFQRNPPRVEATFPFMYTINGRRRALCLKPPA